MKMRSSAPGRAARWQNSTSRPPPRKSRAMQGTSFSLTFPMRPMPPRITAPVSRAVTTPTANRSQPKAASKDAAMELDWTRLPPAREDRAQHRENQAARKGLPSPRAI